MHLHRSNRAEELVSALAEVLSEPLASPLESEVIIVQSKGMERWLSLELAQRFGVWANARFPFPRAFIDEVLDAVVPRAGTQQPTASGTAPDPWSRERLMWTIAALMPELTADGSFERVARYHRCGEEPARLLELSERIADAFDQYAVYRPELVLAWESGAEPTDGADADPDAVWQARLWRMLAARIGTTHTAARARDFFARWPAAGAPRLPRRVSVFGVSSLPPIYLRILSCAAERLEVHLFQLAPSREHVAELSSAREIARVDVGVRERLHLESGNPLLASLGRVARDFQRSLDQVEQVSGEDERFREPGYDCMLHGLQSDLLKLQHRGAQGGVPALPVAPLDTSVVVHCCHGPLRELEVLRDQLRVLFDEDETLEPHDVLVMTPDIDRYAPLIEAVFDADVGEPAFIPYRIADRAWQNENAVAQVFAAASALASGRVTASGLLDLLEFQAVRKRFGIDADDVPRVARWVSEVGVRWGVDGPDRARDGQPALEENTWRFGLRRLALGYAMPGDGRELFMGVLPYDDIEGSLAEPLGQLGDLCDALFALRESFQRPRPVADWCEAFDALLQATVRLDDDGEWQLSEVRGVLAQIAALSRAAGFEQALPVEPMRRLVLRRLAQERTQHAFLSGGVTFCAMLPMRSIPFRVICLLGMNDGAFPRSHRPPSFDLIAAHPLCGDRSLRDEDRYLFLEALLSARERLVVTYTGRNDQDASISPPSVVVGELIDALDDSFRVVPGEGEPGDAADPGGTGAGQRCVVHHPLQPWSRRYFDRSDARLVCRDPAAALGARALAADKVAPPPFLSGPLEPEAGERVVSLEQLSRCLSNPARTLVRERLGVVLDERPKLMQDREPLELDALERHVLGADLLGRALSGAPIRASWNAVRAQGRLPLGTPGKRAFGRLADNVERVLSAAGAWTHGEPLPAIDVDLELAGTRLKGTLEGLWPAAQLSRTYARVRARLELECWVRHLVLQLVAPDPGPRSSVLVGRSPENEGPHVVVFEPVPLDRARTLLEDLIELYWWARRAPICLFPEASRRYVEVLERPGPDEFRAHAALELAREVYAPVEQSRARGARSDPYVALLFEDTDPLAPGFSAFGAAAAAGGSFAELAVRIYGPLLSALRRPGGPA